MRLTTHFTTDEFACHNGQLAPRHSWPRLRRLCRLYLEPLRERYGVVHVHSGYRPAAYNAAVGGAPRSSHIYLPHRSAVAADVSCASGRPADWARELERLGAGGLGLYADHVHVDTRVGHFRWRTLARQLVRAAIRG